MELEIQEIVTKKYKVDGVIFDTPEQAQKYKEYVESLKEKSVIKMFLDDGSETEDIEDADIVYLKGKHAATDFINESMQNFLKYEGIEEGDEGFFRWDHGSYKRIDIDDVDAWYRIIHSIKDDK